MLGGQFIVVDSQHAGQVRFVLRRGGNHDFAGTGVQVAVVSRLVFRFASREKPGRFQCHFHAEIAPREVARVTLCADLDLLQRDGIILLERPAEADSR